MKRPNITPGEWTAEPAMENQDCGIRIHTPESAAYGMAHIYSPGANAEANARAIAALPALLTALEALHAIGKDGVAMRHETGKPTWSALEETKKLTQAALIEAGYTF